MCKGNDIQGKVTGSRSDRTDEPGETGSVEAQAEERGQGCMSRNFWENIPIDCVKAIAELKRLKVYKLCAWDYEETFSDVWWLVLHEVDMYAEGEFVREASRSYFHTGDPEAMNLKQAQRADSWLLKWKHLLRSTRTLCIIQTFIILFIPGFRTFLIRHITMTVK
jgi:hypothetical protein